MTKHLIMGVHITDRLEQAVEVQRTLTEFGGFIKTRLGLHEVGARRAAPAGLLLLELTRESECRKLARKLGRIKCLEVKTMVFDH